MPRATDLVGLAGAAVVVAALVVAAGRRLGLRRSGLAVLAVASGVAALVPIGAVPVAGLLRGIVGDLSLTTLVLLLRSLGRDIRGGDPADPRSTVILQGLVAVGGVVLYPLALGLAPWDPYRLGYGDPWFLAALLAVALAALVLDVPLVTFCVSLAVLAWSLGACESRNLWDCLIDPLVFVWAASALLARVLPSRPSRDGSVPRPPQPKGEAMHTRMTDVARRIVTVAALCAVLPAASTLAQAAAPFDSSPLVALGDTVKYGSYVVYKIGEGVYKINDPGVTTGKGGAWGVDMYLMCGDSRALMVDLGNNYMDGYAKDVIAPRPNAAEELREVVYALAGKRALEIAITHAHPDHDGMTGAFLGGKATLWMSDGEDKTALKTQHGIDSSVYSLFTPGQKTFDLGGGRTVETILVRGHSNGGTVYLLKKDMLLFTGDALGSGFGQAFRSVDRLRTFAEDARKLVEHISSGFAPYERYALRVYTGHTWQNVYGGFLFPDKEKVDVGYLDWRFVQDVASCANGILGGKWLVEGSGLNRVGKMAYTDAWPGAAGQAIMVYGTGTMIVPLETAYEAAGLKMPQ